MSRSGEGLPAAAIQARTSASPSRQFGSARKTGPVPLAARRVDPRSELGELSQVRANQKHVRWDAQPCKCGQVDGS